MSQTLFKSWFVDFDPVIDNALDAGNPIRKRCNLAPNCVKKYAIVQISNHFRRIFVSVPG
jgi:hypothetical protein